VSKLQPVVILLGKIDVGVSADVSGGGGSRALGARPSGR